MYQYSLMLGDYCGDGHGKFEAFWIQSNKECKDINKAESKVNNIFGFTAYNIFVEYEDNVLKQKHYDKLIELGFKPKESFDKDSMMPNDLVEVWKFMVETADPELEITILETPERVNVKSMGYGLFF